MTIVIPEHSASSPQTKPVEVELIEQTDSQKKTEAPLVRFAESPKENLDDTIEALKKKANYLSEKVQRVKKEMRANLFGLTKNRFQDKSSPSQKNKRSFNPETRQKPLNEEGDLHIRAESSEANNHPLELNPSAFGNQVNKDVTVGNFTALNTDRHLFYSFYARIEEMIRPPWEDKIRYESRVLAQTPHLTPKGGWATRLDVILNPHGKLVRVVLLKSSGVGGFDDAAIDAFKKADFFPHPPREMVTEDGTIVLKYIFTVY